MYLLLICLPLLSFLLACGFGRFFGIRGRCSFTTLCVACTSAGSICCFYEVGFVVVLVLYILLHWFHSELFDASWGFYLIALLWLC